MMVGHAARRAHVLLIDDSQELLAVFQRLLKTAGYRVTTSRTLLSQEQILALAPDVLVLELVTPDGVDLEWDYLTRLRRDRETSGLPVVLCTTASWNVCQPATVEQLDRLGVRVVLKPCRAAELVHAVAGVLRAQDLADEHQARGRLTPP